MEIGEREEDRVRDGLGFTSHYATRATLLISDSQFLIPSTLALFLSTPSYFRARASLKTGSEVCPGSVFSRVHEITLG